jgi:drug/metabolite transporter (DMT)-like permease
MATLAYAIVLWALSQGGMAQVSALRETSVIIAAAIGTRLLREPFGARRVLAAAVVAAGVVLLQS